MSKRDLCVGQPAAIGIGHSAKGETRLRGHSERTREPPRGIRSGGRAGEQDPAGVSSQPIEFGGLLLRCDGGIFDPHMFPAAMASATAPVSEYCRFLTAMAETLGSLRSFLQGVPVVGSTPTEKPVALAASTAVEAGARPPTIARFRAIPGSNPATAPPPRNKKNLRRDNCIQVYGGTPLRTLGLVQMSQRLDNGLLHKIKPKQQNRHSED